MEEEAIYSSSIDENLSKTTTDGPICTIIVRVLKRYAYSKTLLFMDVTYFNEEEKQYEFGSIVVRSENLSLLSGIISGHVLKVKGIIQNHHISLGDGPNRPSILTLPEDIEVLEPWNMGAYGFFSFEVVHISPTTPYFKGHRICCELPILALQVKHKSCERLIEVVQSKFPSPSFTVRESSTCYIKTNDRLIILSPSSRETVRSNYSEAMKQIIQDPILSPYIMRVYSGYDESVTVVPFVCSASLDFAFNKTIQLIHSYNESIKASSSSTAKIVYRVRLHTFPKYIVDRLLDWPLPFPVAWSPTDYDFVLSITMIDGLWMISLTAKEDTYIGDLREKKITPKIKLNQPEKSLTTPGTEVNEVEDNICRAAAKIEEIMRRNDWIYTEPSLFTHYQLAVDIGASPGGWTSFLSQSVDAKLILSVDRGDLLIPPPRSPKIVYWQVHGEEAIDRLRSIHQGSNATTIDRQEDLLSRKIDLFCCDANISPYHSIQFLFTCKEHNLLASKGRFIITFKNVFGRKDEWEIGMTECMKKLDTYPFHTIQMVHLLANTPKEVTVTGYYDF